MTDTEFEQEYYELDKKEAAREASGLTPYERKHALRLYNIAMVRNSDEQQAEAASTYVTSSESVPTSLGLCHEEMFRVRELQQKSVTSSSQQVFVIPRGRGGFSSSLWNVYVKLTIFVNSSTSVINSKRVSHRTSKRIELYSK